MRQRLCKVCGCWHELEDWPSECARAPSAARSSLSAPMVIGDVMTPVQSMLDGKLYDSKSALRATYRAAGVREVGNDVKTTPPPKKPIDRKAVRASVERAFSRAGMGA